MNYELLFQENKNQSSNIVIYPLDLSIKLKLNKKNNIAYMRVLFQYFILEFIVDITVGMLQIIIF